MRAKKTCTKTRQEQIARAALELIGKEGLDAFSVAGVARRVGIVPSALYRHYCSKGSVLDAALQLLGDHLLSNVAAARAGTQDAVRQLERLALRHAQLLAENPGVSQLVLSGYAYGGSASGRERVGDIITQYLDQVAEMVRQGQGRGLIRDDVDARAAAVAFLGLVLPAAVFRDVTGGQYDLAKHVRDAWPVFERGITVGPTRPAL